MAELTTVGIARGMGKRLPHGPHADSLGARALRAALFRVHRRGYAAAARRRRRAFLALFPDAVETAAERSRNRHSLGIVAGIVDEEWTEESGIREMRGLLRLDGPVAPVAADDGFSLARREAARTRG